MKLSSDSEIQRQARAALDDARAELRRARSALGHAALRAGLAAHIAWVGVVDGVAEFDVERVQRPLYRWLRRAHPEVPIARLARVLRGCDCDSRDPQICSGRADERWDDQRHTWCCCVACHGSAVASPGARAAQREGDKGGSA